MAQITDGGNPTETIGTLPAVGSTAKSFTLVKNDLSETSLQDYAGKNVVLNIFPSIDTPVCANSTRRFNEELNKLSNTVILCVSVDLPYANKRFCGAENLTNVTTLSAFRAPEFGKDYGVTITTGPRRGMLSRAIVIIDRQGKVSYTEQVPEIKQDPNFAAALKHLAG